MALSMEKPPQIHCTIDEPTYGIAERRLVITVAPQKDIWPHGRTYPRKAVAMVTNRISTPMLQVSCSLNDI